MNPEDIEDDISVDVDSEAVPESEDPVDNGDGTVSVMLDDEAPGDERGDGEFFDNLADNMDDVALDALAVAVLEKVERDKESRQDRAKQYADTLARLGLSGDPPGGASFQGASKAVHPMMMQASIDFASAAVKELWPVGGEDPGPAKMHIVGKATQDKVDRARRKAKFLNWQLQTQVKGFRDDLEQTLSQIPLAGAGYLKAYWDHSLSRIDIISVPVDEVYLPYDASSLLAARRYTHAQRISAYDMTARIETGFYREIDLAAPEVPETTEPQNEIDRAQGREPGNDNLDGDRIVYETMCREVIEADTLTGGRSAPYLITIDETTRKVLAIYRNWSPDDPQMEPLDHIVEFPFIPFRGGAIGLPQAAGGLSIAATGALRALLDSAHINNIPSALRLKGGGKGGQNVEMVPGQIAEVDSSPNTDDIRKTIMPLPFNPPSSVLFQLLGFLTDAGQSIIESTQRQVADQNPNAPVGTTLALIEQGAKVFSAIHARLHGAMGRLLCVAHRLNGLYLKDSTTVRELGELIVRRDDFEGSPDIIPVSDPNIYSETQRMAQMQMVASRAAAMPQIYNMRKVEELILERSKIPDAKGLLVPVPEPKRLNAVNENVAASMGQPLVVFPDQDHIAHLRMHIAYLSHPMFGANMLVAPGLIPQMLTHLKDHIVYWYVSTVAAITDAATGGDSASLMDDDPEVDAEFNRLLVEASSRALAIAPDELGSIGLEQTIQQAMAMMQQLQAMQQGNMPDPNMAMVEVQREEVARKAAADERKAQIEAEREAIRKADIELKARKLALEEQEAQAKLGIEVRKHGVDTAVKREDIAARVAMNESDNRTGRDIAAARIAQGMAPGVTTGTGINP